MAALPGWSTTPGPRARAGLGSHALHDLLGVEDPGQDLGVPETVLERGDDRRALDDGANGLRRREGVEALDEDERDVDRPHGCDIRGRPHGHLAIAAVPADGDPRVLDGLHDVRLHVEQDGLAPGLGEARTEHAAHRACSHDHDFTAEESPLR